MKTLIIFIKNVIQYLMLKDFFIFNKGGRHLTYSQYLRQKVIHL
jgi:hypothetical protein